MMPTFPNAKYVSAMTGALMLSALCGGSAEASSNPPLYTLPWAVKGERLTYRSCGCADACWVAELRDLNSKRVKATLRCDCASLYLTYPMNRSERKVAESCSVINDRDDKLSEVSREMKRAIERAPAK
jgi:hypothetical protein